MPLCVLSFSFTAVFGTFGILLDIKNLGNNIFLNQILLGVVDIPIKLLTYFIMRNVNRRPSIAFSLLTIGSCTTITIFLAEGETSSVFRILLLMHIHVYVDFSNSKCNLHCTV